LIAIQAPLLTPQSAVSLKRCVHENRFVTSWVIVVLCTCFQVVSYSSFDLCVSDTVKMYHWNASTCFAPDVDTSHTNKNKFPFVKLRSQTLSHLIMLLYSSYIISWWKYSEPDRFLETYLAALISNLIMSFKSINYYCYYWSLCNMNFWYESLKMP